MTIDEGLRIDPSQTIEEIAAAIRTQVRDTLHRRGAVVGISGGIDSAVVAGLCAQALGPERVLGLLMPERHSSPESLLLARAVAARFGIATLTEPLEPALTAIGCYSRQADAIRTVEPDFGDGWRFKLALPPLLDSERLNVTLLIIENPEGKRRSLRLSADAYRALVAATNFKQRLRAAMAYHHADRPQYAVAGTPNRLEHELGFFVKHGDGAADLNPIAHLYKTQVYALAEQMEVPPAVRARQPTTDTFSLPQSQEEFFFALPLTVLDACLWAHDHDLTAGEAAEELRLTRAQVERVFRDIDAKRRATVWQHAEAALGV